MTAPILPTAESIVTPAVNAMVAMRPRIRGHIERGRYGDIAYGWAGEARVLRAELAQLVASRFLPTAEGQALVKLVQSDEFGAPIVSAPTPAFGRLLLERPDTGPLEAGEIRAGTKFRVNANPRAIPPVQESTVEVIEHVGVAEEAEAVWVPVKATAAGAGPNIPTFPGSNEVSGQPLSDLFDATFVVAGAELAGGGTGLTDATVRRAGTAAYIGRHGATEQALIIGVLCSGLGVEHVTPVQDDDRGIAQLFVADASWAANEVWCREVQRALYVGGWVGFGCRPRVLPVTNRIAHVEATVRLRDMRYADERAELTNKVVKAIDGYFDERPDFWTFDVAGVATAIARADRTRILSVPTAPSLLSATGDAITPPAANPTDVASVAHFAIRSVRLTFQRPNGTAL